MQNTQSFDHHLESGTNHIVAKHSSDQPLNLYFPGSGTTLKHALGDKYKWFNNQIVPISTKWTVLSTIKQMETCAQEQVQLLRELFEKQPYKDNPAQKINIIGHSHGGIKSMAFLAELSKPENKALWDRIQHVYFASPLEKICWKQCTKSRAIGASLRRSKNNPSMLYFWEKIKENKGKHSAHSLPMDLYYSKDDKIINMPIIVERLRKEMPHMEYTKYYWEGNNADDKSNHLIGLYSICNEPQGNKRAATLASKRLLQEIIFTTILKRLKKEKNLTNDEITEIFQTAKQQKGYSRRGLPSISDKKYEAKKAFSIEFQKACKNSGSLFDTLHQENKHGMRTRSFLDFLETQRINIDNVLY